MDRRSAIKLVAGAIGTVNQWSANAAKPPQGPAASFTVQSSQLTLELSEQGEITGAHFAGAGGEEEVGVKGKTVLAGCTVHHVTTRKLAGGTVEFTKALTSQDAHDACTLVERFSPADSGSIRWEIEILSDRPPRSTPIETHILWPAVEETRFWTTWGDSRPENSTGWNDPLVPTAFAARQLHFGAQDIWKSQAISVPIATILERAKNRGLSLALSPEDSMVELDLVTSPAGEMVFSRRDLRIGKERPVRFAMDLVSHDADWRAAMGWIVARYPLYFDPPNPMTHAIAGNGAYAEFEGELDAYKYFAMGFRVNWKASYDWYMMGLFLPPVADDVEFVSARITSGRAEFPTSISRLRGYSEQMRAQGFQVLNYFNSQEFGLNIVKTSPPPPRKAKDDADLWRDPNDLAYYVLRDALIRDEEGKLNSGGQGDVLVDPGAPVYQRLMLQQARLHMEKFPASAGICFDELQYLRNYNLERDDGISWKNGRPARSLVFSWQDLMDKLGPVVHDAGKVIYANPLYRRLDVMKHLDGFYDEFAFEPYSLNAVALMAVRKPYIAWTRDIHDPDPDAYFQRHLHLGAFVTAPYPINNHAIMPSGTEIDRAYLEYGPLFDALRGRAWVLQAGCIEVEGGAKSNLFSIPGGYLAAVTFGGERGRAVVRLNGLEKMAGQEGFAIEVLHPGKTAWTAIQGRERGGSITVDLPLERGCALVRLSYLWIKPDRHNFIGRQTVQMGTTLDGAELRYTTDGSDPDSHSPVYREPIVVIETTNLKLAAFRNGLLIGRVLHAELVKSPPPAPWIDPFSSPFQDKVSVRLSNPYPLPTAEIRYTLDGSEVNNHSPIYSVPIELIETTTLRTKMFLPEVGPGVAAERKFCRMQPMPSSPDVHLSDLMPIKVFLQEGGGLKKDVSLGGTPLSVAGKRFLRGLGVVSASDLVYKLDPSYGSFVAIVGLDDNVQARYADMATFRIYVRNEREELLLHETPMLYPGEYWPMEIKIPLASLEIRLSASGGMDGDRVDWANAGFRFDRNNQGAALIRELRREAGRAPETSAKSEASGSEDRAANLNSS